MKYYTTVGIARELPKMLIDYLFALFFNLPEPRDELQIFKLYVEDGKQKICHMQEVPEYKKVYCYPVGGANYNETVFIEKGGYFLNEKDEAEGKITECWTMCFPSER